MADFYSSVRIYKLCFRLTQYALNFIPRMLSNRFPVAETTELFTNQTPPTKYLEPLDWGGQLVLNQGGTPTLKLV
jgi:hypothetical protein